MTTAHRPRVRTAVPEDLIDRSGGPVRLDVRCRACGNEAREEFEWATVDPTVFAADSGDDGFVLSRILTCPHCRAVDDYDLTQQARLQLVGELEAGGRSSGRVMALQARLWDGTPMRRPTQALAHLRQLTAEQPDRAEAHRRLGNFCERFGLLDEAVPAWTRAADLDPDDFEAAWSLAYWHFRHSDDGDRLLHWMQRGLKAWCPDCRRDATVRRFASGLAKVLLAVAADFPADLTLMATWSAGERGKNVFVRASQADLRLVDDADALADFLERDDLIAVLLGQGPIEDQPTQLQLLLAGAGLPPVQSAQPVRLGPKVGRNDPCPCGSGKKWKRCCGQ